MGAYGSAPQEALAARTLDRMPGLRREALVDAVQHQTLEDLHHPLILEEHVDELGVVGVIGCELALERRSTRTAAC